MNKIITKEQFHDLKPIDSLLVGSRLHSTNNKDSDTDVIWIVENNDFIDDNSTYQFTDSFGDYIICTQKRFIEVRVSGSDLVFFEAKPIPANYAIIRAYLGVAKRDWKEYLKIGKLKKKYHSIRCFIFANHLIYASHSIVLIKELIRATASSAQEVIQSQDSSYDDMLGLIKHQRYILNTEYKKI
jgi:predicted nucleotidyltransferase